MKRLGLAIAAVLALALPAQSQTKAASPAVGIWQGEVKSGSNTIRVALRLDEPKPGQWTCLAEFEGRPEAIRCPSLIVDGDKVVFAVRAVGGVFEGGIAEGGAALTGTWQSTTAPTQPLRLARTPPAQAWRLDPAPHKQSFVTASDGVRLEVLDFGGSGPPLLFVTGLGGTGHTFDAFAPRLTDSHHVYALTRRGAGESDRPPPTAEFYRTSRLGDDVVEVMNALKIQRAALAGWSFGGAELSSVATRFPERVTGLVYLDAAYVYAFYAPGNEQDGTNVEIALNALRDRLAAARTLPPAQADKAMEEVLKVSLPNLAADIARRRQTLQLLAANPAAAGPPPASPTPYPTPRYPPLTVPAPAAIGEVIMLNSEAFPPLQPPVLAFYAGKQDYGPIPPAVASRYAEGRGELVERFRAGNPNAKVIVVPGAEHAVFASNPDDILREMRPFLAGLPK